MLIGRIYVFGYLLDLISAFFIDSASHINYLAFLEERLMQLISFLSFGSFAKLKFMVTSLKSILRNK